LKAAHEMKTKFVSM